MLRSNSKSLQGIHVVSSEEEKEGCGMGRVCRKGRFYAWNEKVSGCWCSSPFLRPLASEPADLELTPGFYP